MRHSKAVIKYVHAISPCDRDVSAADYEITSDDLATAKDAKAWVKRVSNQSLPLKPAPRRTEDGGWVFFPMRKRGSVWWSVSVRLDVEQVRRAALECTCRNHPAPEVQPEPEEPETCMDCGAEILGYHACQGRPNG
jgi:hypothetical protein